MRGKAARALQNTMPSLKEVQMKMQADYFNGEEDKVAFDKKRIAEQIAEHMRMVGATKTDAHPGIAVKESSDLHKRSLEHAKLYLENQKRDSSRP